MPRYEFDTALPRIDTRQLFFRLVEVGLPVVGVADLTFRGKVGVDTDADVTLSLAQRTLAQDEVTAHVPDSGTETEDARIEFLNNINTWLTTMYNAEVNWATLTATQKDSLLRLHNRVLFRLLHRLKRSLF